VTSSLQNDAAHELGDRPACAVRERGESDASLLGRHGIKALARGVCQRKPLPWWRGIADHFMQWLCKLCRVGPGVRGV